MKPTIGAVPEQKLSFESRVHRGNPDAAEGLAGSSFLYFLEKNAIQKGPPAHQRLSLFCSL
jgi:hypothetical protein